MEIKIKRFMNLQDINLVTPATITGKNGSGKTSILRAYLWVMSGKDIDGTMFSENVYPTIIKSIEDCNADVTVILEGRFFRKETNGKEVRKSGEEESTIIKSISTKYHIDGQIVDSTSFANEVKKYTKGFDFQLFTNPNYFEKMSMSEKRDVFQQFFNFKEFTPEIDMNTLRTAIKNASEKRKELKSQIKGFAEIEKPEAVKCIDFDSQIIKIEKQIKESTPVLTSSEIEENNKILEKIDLLQKKELMKPKDVPLVKSIPLIPTSDLKQKIKDAENEVFSSFEKTNQVSRLIDKRNNIKNLFNALELNTCETCSLCTLKDCPSRLNSGRTKEDIQFEIDLIEDKNLDLIQQKIESLTVQIKNEEVEFEQSKKEKIEKLKASLEKIEAENLIIEAENAGIKEMNLSITTKNTDAYKEFMIAKEAFETKKQLEINKLQKGMNFAKSIDNSEMYEKLENLKSLKGSQQAKIDIFNEEVGAYKNAVSQIETKTKEVEILTADLAKKERTLILQKDSELSYYMSLQKKLNEKLPENIEVSLFEKNKSNDNISLIFDLKFSSSKYYSQGQRVVFFTKLCEFFQNEAGVNFPIFIDEVGVLDSESIAKISEIEDFIKLQPSDENLELI